MPLNGTVAGFRRGVRRKGAEEKPGIFILLLEVMVLEWIEREKEHEGGSDRCQDEGWKQWKGGKNQAMKILNGAQMADSSRAPPQVNNCLHDVRQQNGPGSGW